MTIHYHGLPVTPLAVLYELAGNHFCVSHAYPEQVRIAHEIGQSVVLDNGAFSAWRQGKGVNWPSFYAWCETWFAYPNTWGIIPDVITGTEAQQDLLIRQWPHGSSGAPVWHMHESVERLLGLIERWPRVCIGSSNEYAVVLSDMWRARMDETWNAIVKTFGRTPWIHMLRGMQLVFHPWPFASVDSTDVARNHNRPQNSAKAMADRWNARQCPGIWVPTMEQMDLFASGRAAA